MLDTYSVAGLGLRITVHIARFSINKPSTHGQAINVRSCTLANLRVQILSFRHTKFFKRNRLGSWRPLPTRSTPSPTGNPGSAAAFIRIPHHSHKPSINHISRLHSYLTYNYKTFTKYQSYQKETLVGKAYCLQFLRIIKTHETNFLIANLMLN